MHLLETFYTAYTVTTSVKVRIGGFRYAIIEMIVMTIGFECNRINKTLMFKCFTQEHEQTGFKLIDSNLTEFRIN